MAASSPEASMLPACVRLRLYRLNGGIAMAMRATGGKVVTGWLHHHLRQTARAPYNCACDRITHVTQTATLTECSNVWSAHYPRQQCRHGDTYNMVPRSQAHAHMQRVSAVSVARNIAVGGGVTVCTVVCGGSRRFTAVHGVSRRIHGVSRFVHGSVPANIRWKLGRQGCHLRGFRGNIRSRRFTGFHGASTEFHGLFTGRSRSHIGSKVG